MNGGTWRLAAVTLCVATVALQYVGQFGPPAYVPLRETASIITTVTPAATAAGIRVGNVIDGAALNAVQAYRLQGMPRGTRVEVPVRRGARTQFVVLPAMLLAPKDQLGMWTFVSTLLAMTLCAFISVRRPGAMTFALSGATGGTLFSWYLMTPALASLPVWLFEAIMAPLRIYGNVYPPLLLAAFAVRLPGTKPTPQKQRAVRIVDAVVLGGLVAEIVREFVRPMTYADPSTKPYFLAFAGLAVAASMYAAYAAVRYSRREEISRVYVVLAALLVSVVMYPIAGTFGFGATGPARVLALALFMVGGMLVPAALAYAILRHRVFDIAFAVNRGLVYAITSMVVLVALAGLEFLTERYLTHLRHIESFAIEFVIALVVILTARLVHRQIDRFVDTVLFRARHEQEAALRQFARTVQFYTAQEPLARDTVRAMVRYGRVQGAALYLSNEKRLVLANEVAPFADVPATIDENDAAFVALRAIGREVETTDFETSFPGLRLYPMILIGNVAGVIAVGERESGEAMPPDIDDAIQRVASAVAIALSSIEASEVRRELAQLRPLSAVR